jgi:hypothetical protein
MQFVIAFNVVLLLLALGIARRVLPVTFLTSFITGLHYTIGISTPTPAQVRRAALIWIACVLIIVDVLYVLLLFVF